MTMANMAEAVPKGRILVVDDEAHNRELLEAILEGQGYEVVCVDNGATALEKAATATPHVILLDVMMPGMDGFEVCRRLKQDRATAAIPVLMITALTERPQRLKGIDTGANDFLSKPIDREDVALRVRNAVYTKRLYDQVQAELERITKLETLRDNLTHMIVHDMRSPLTGVDGAYEIILMEKDRLSQTQQEFVAMGRNSCRELIEMVSSLLDVSRMEAGQMPLNRLPCDIRDIARGAAESVAVLAQGKTLTVSVTGDSVSSAVDRDIMQRVFVNLLGNAIKFSPSGSEIAVRTSQENDLVRVAVSDSGPGIAPEYQARIFEKFGQVESRKAHTKYSTGLGLTFCKLAVEAHGGRIGVDSAEGKGSTFWIELPATNVEM
ncbi:MAG: response regulator [Verrucomicrobia bacterium]|nr:response regulator [Verrucomicrobiota bacterium]